MRWLLPWLLAACAAESIGPQVPIRGGGTPDAALVDLAVEDAARPTDADVPPLDAAPPPTSAERTVWYLLRHDAPVDGVRAALDPPQTPAPFADPVLPALVEWQGPDSVGAEVLRRRLAQGLPTAPFYLMAGRADAAASDVSWLAAHALEAPAAITLGDRPVLAVAPAPGRAGLDALRARLAQLPVDPLLLVEVDLDDRPWPAADGIFAKERTGALPDPAGQNGPRIRAGRAAALAAGWLWIPRAGPPPNARLSDPLAEVSADAEAALVRSLVVSRRMTTPARPIVLLDALGGWRDDRQLDPVEGRTTAAPEDISAGVDQIAYGQGRLQAVADHLAMVRAEHPPRFASTALLLDATADAPATLPADAGAYRIEALDGRAEWLLDGRPFRLGAGARLSYARAGEAWIDLQFADGPALHERLAIPPVGPVTVDLSAFADLIVEAVVIEATGPGTVDAIRLED